MQNPLTYTDPTGEAVPALIVACAGNPVCAAAVGAGVGAVAGALLDVGSQLLGNGGNLQCIDKGSVALSAGVGAVPFGAVGALSSKILGKFVTNTKGAESSIKGLKLQKQLTSQEQLGQLSKGGGIVINQPAKQANRIAAQTGRNPTNIQKVSSDVRVMKDGQQIQTHSFRDSSTNKLIETKTIIGD